MNILTRDWTLYIELNLCENNEVFQMLYEVTTYDNVKFSGGLNEKKKALCS